MPASGEAASQGRPFAVVVDAKKFTDPNPLVTEISCAGVLPFNDAAKLSCVEETFNTPPVPVPVPTVSETGTTVVVPEKFSGVMVMLPE